MRLCLNIQWRLESCSRSYPQVTGQRLPEHQATRTGKQNMREQGASSTTGSAAHCHHAGGPTLHGHAAICRPLTSITFKPFCCTAWSCAASADIEMEPAANASSDAAAAAASLPLLRLAAVLAVRRCVDMLSMRLDRPRGGRTPWPGRPHAVLLVGTAARSCAIPQRTLKLRK